MGELKKYVEALNDAIYLTENYIKQLPEIAIYKTILNQLLYVNSIVAGQNRKPTEDEVEPVTFGIIAIKNFDEDDERYRTMLINLYGDFERFSEE